MDISRDQVRRELGEIGRSHDEAMTLHAAAVDRILDDNDASTAERAEFLTGGLNRRRFLRFGGLAVATSAVFAACGSTSGSTSSPTTAAPTTTGGTGSGNATDIVILRTATSLEALAVQTYQTAISSGLVTDSTVAAVAKDFMGQHQQHLQQFAAATTQAGGQAFTQPNPVVYSQVIQPALAKVKTQTDVLALAYTLESAAAQTYQSTVGVLSKPAYNTAVMSVGGVESRHVALLGLVLNSSQYPPYPAQGFQTDTGAVKAGTGV